MKGLFKVLLSVLLLSINVLKAQTIDEILKTYEEKNGGTENFAVVSTLQYTSVFKANMMGRPIDFSSQVFIETGKLFRKDMAPMMGMKGVYTLITDTGGFTFTPTIQGFGDFPGNDGGVVKMDTSLYNKCKHKINATNEFGDLMDCKSKGFVPEFLGKESIDKKECFKIKLTYRDGSSKLFWVNTTTYLISQFEINGQQIVDFIGIYAGPMYDMMGKRMSKNKSIVTVTEYATVEGIKIPSNMKVLFGNNEVEIVNTEIQVNASIDKKWYKN